MATTTAVAQPASQGALVRFLKSPRGARILFPISFVVFWQLMVPVINSRVFPGPLRVVQFMWDEITLDSVARTNVYTSFGISLGRLFAAFALAMVIGTVIGLGMGLSRSVDAFFHDWVMAILAMPALAWALFTGLVFGFGNEAPILTALLSGVPFVIINVREGVRNSPRELFDMARSFRVPQKRITRHVLIPSLMPFMFAAARYGFSIGWKGLVIGEVFASTRGAGWMIKYWYDARRAHGIFGYALFFIMFALVTERYLFEATSRRVFKWRPQVAGVEIVEEMFPVEGGARQGVAVGAGSDVVAPRGEERRG